MAEFERLTPEQTKASDELQAFTGWLFLKHNIPIGVGVRILATMVTWMAIESELSSEEYGNLMRQMHETMKKGK